MQRHVAATGLEDRKQRDHQVHGPLHQDRNGVLGADAVLGQPRGEPLRTGVELGIGELGLAGHQGHRVGRTPGLLLEQPVQG
ncbi:hypothetical protein EES40_21575 [Streptomyces sp. ADI93-02]|nr:hypothetical protein EES40_21575 [Streptomyces sp. ADI93-02]